jgi:choice-of-anchor C domain-containing protein
LPLEAGPVRPVSGRAGGDGAAGAGAVPAGFGTGAPCRRFGGNALTGGTGGPGGAPVRADARPVPVRRAVGMLCGRTEQHLTRTNPSSDWEAFVKKVVRLAVAAVAAGALTAGAAGAVAAPRETAPRGPVAAPPPAAPFANGSFESPPAPVNLYTTYSAGQSFGQWTVAAGGVDLIGPGFWQAAAGVQSVDLNAVQPGTVRQTFATTPGHTYTVSYSLAGNPGGAPAVKTGQVLVNGQHLQSFSFDTTGRTRAAMGWVTKKLAFVAETTETTLTFASTTQGSAGPAIDNVRLHVCVAP